ncbi:MAG: helix-turn-helix transcriptional regulator [Clostridia bacterium]|nr:helix-turn-helix transcriptional regulator [Clostridia bacterium]
MRLDERLKELRELNGLTQTELAKKMNVTRSSVNGWEMGIVVPSTMKLIELSTFFHVTTDYLLGLDDSKRLDIDSLSEEECAIIYSMIAYFDKQKETE